MRAFFFELNAGPVLESRDVLSCKVQLVDSFWEFILRGPAEGGLKGLTGSAGGWGLTVFKGSVGGAYKRFQGWLTGARPGQSLAKGTVPPVLFAYLLYS